MTQMTRPTFTGNLPSKVDWIDLLEFSGVGICLCNPKQDLRIFLDRRFWAWLNLFGHVQQWSSLPPPPTGKVPYEVPLLEEYVWSFPFSKEFMEGGACEKPQKWTQWVWVPNRP